MGFVDYTTKSAVITVTPVVNGVAGVTTTSTSAAGAMSQLTQNFAADTTNDFGVIGNNGVGRRANGLMGG
jgi:hypothetical protein